MNCQQVIVETQGEMVELDSPIDKVLTDYPQVTRLLVRLRMMCAGCDIARFHTVQEVAEVYHLDTHHFLADIRQIAQESSGTPGVRS